MRRSSNLAHRPGFVTVSAMKFFLAIAAYLLIGVVLGCGIYLGMAKGSWWFLVAGTVAYVFAFAKMGCLPKKSH